MALTLVLIPFGRMRASQIVGVRFGSRYYEITFVGRVLVEGSLPFHNEFGLVSEAATSGSSLTPQKESGFRLSVRPIC